MTRSATVASCLAMEDDRDITKRLSEMSLRALLVMAGWTVGLSREQPESDAKWWHSNEAMLRASWLGALRAMTSHVRLYL